MNNAENLKTPFATELRASPRIVLAVLVIVGVIVQFSTDDMPDGGVRFIAFGLLIHGATVLLWLANRRWPRLGAWLMIMVLVWFIVLSYIWLHIPGILFLISIPAIFAMTILGFGGALFTAIVESALLLGLAIYNTIAPGVIEIYMALSAIWMTMGALYLWQQQCDHLAQWSWNRYQYAQEVLQEIRDERVAQSQLEADLLLANRELARMTNRLKVLHQLAEEARQVKEQFVANVSHELRTPLNMIIGFSDIISRSSKVYGIKLPPALLADIAVIRRNSQHLAKLVDDVLDLSQLEVGRMALSKEWTSIKELVEQSIITVRPLYESKNLCLKSELPEADTLPLLFCDSTRIRQVLINLLSNAGRFTEEGGVCLTVRQEEESVVFYVTDTGCGISPEEQQHLFEPFYQVDRSLHRSHGGSGLGLAISKQFVEMHRGKMWVESEVGVGTTVAFSLPCPTEIPTTTETNQALRASERLSGYNPNAQFDGRTEPSKAPAPQLARRFLLLEEGKTLQRLFTRYREDVEVTSVRNLADAIHELSRLPANALVINEASYTQGDIPIEQLAELPYNTPILSCYVADENVAALHLGVNRYLVKPIAYETLLATLAEVCPPKKIAPGLDKRAGMSIEKDTGEKGGEEPQTVLLVDDDREVLHLLSRMLTSTERPYRVLQTSSGHRALEILRKRQPDVMLLDLMMPGMDGFQILEQKRQDPAICDIPVVIISAQDPNGQPIVSRQLTIIHNSGLSGHTLLNCIQRISDLLSPLTRSAGQA